MAQDRDARERDEALATPRHVDADFYYPGAGELLVRLAWLPSFDAPVLWEVRSVDGVLVGFRSVGTPESEDRVTGHEKLSVSDDAIRSVLDRLATVSLPLTVSLASTLVADGARYIATIARGRQTGCRFHWHEGAVPEAWPPAVEAVLDLRQVLEHGAPALPTGSQPMFVNCTGSTANLVRLETGEFQVLDPGEMGSLLTGHDYILATAPLADALRTACGDDVEIKPANIVRKSTGESWSTYAEVTPTAELKGPDDLPLARHSGRRTWHYQRGHLFVNAEVKASLAKLALDDLTFSSGFSEFVGMRSY